MNLYSIGWNGFFEATFNSLSMEDAVPARIGLEQRERYTVLCERGELTATVSGRLRHQARGQTDLPAVGDWGAVRIADTGDRAVIHHVLPRRTAFTRRAVHSGGMPETGGKTEQQVLAANVDTVFLISGLDRDYNLRRIERYLTVAWDSGAIPVVVLNKADLCDDPESYRHEVAGAAIGVDIHLVSATAGDNMDRLQRHIWNGQTVALLGSSGVGKSTIINYLCGEDRLTTQEVRDDDQRGRHTTTHRELVLLPDGGCLIDTPGLRGLQPFTSEEGFSRTFDDIEGLAQSCRFRDCSHKSEPGCAVLAAVETGELDEGRYENYLKMLRELAYLERRRSQRAKMIERDKWKAITKRMRKHYKKKR